MPYFNNRRRARSQRSKQYPKSPNKRAVTYRNHLALESALSEQRLKNEQHAKDLNRKSKRSILEILEEKESREKEKDSMNSSPGLVSSDSEEDGDVRELMEKEFKKIELQRKQKNLNAVFDEAAIRQQKFSPTIAVNHVVPTNSLLAPYALGQGKNFLTRLQGRAYADLTQARKKEIERKLKQKGFTLKHKKKRKIPKIGYDVKDPKGQYSYILGMAQSDRLSNFAFMEERKKTLDEKRFMKMRSTLWRMHAQMVSILVLLCRFKILLTILLIFQCLSRPRQHGTSGCSSLLGTRKSMG